MLLKKQCDSTQMSSIIKKSSSNIKTTLLVTQEKITVNYSKKIIVKLTALLLIYSHAQPIYSQRNSSIIDNTKIIFLTIFRFLQKTKSYLLEEYNTYFEELSCRNKIDNYIDAVASGKLNQVFLDLESSDLSIAESAFSQLKKWWPWQREHTFLIPNLDGDIEESCFLKVLDVNIMKICEENHITRQDYIAKYMDEGSIKKIRGYKEHCISLQKEGDLNALLNKAIYMRDRVIKNGKKTVLIDNIYLAIVQKISEDPITKYLHDIRYAPTLKESEEALAAFHKYLEEELYPQLYLKNTQNI